MESEWITSGEAAKLLGYSRRHFVDKFDGRIPSRRFGHGHRRWLKVAVLELVPPPLPQVG